MRDSSLSAKQHQGGCRKESHIICEPAPVAVVPKDDRWSNFCSSWSIFSYKCGGNMRDAGTFWARNTSFSNPRPSLLGKMSSISSDTIAFVSSDSSSFNFRRLISPHCRRGQTMLSLYDQKEESCRSACRQRSGNFLLSQQFIRPFFT